MKLTASQTPCPEDWDSQRGGRASSPEQDALSPSEQQENQQKLKERAIACLSQRSLTQHQMEERLTQWGGTPQEVEAICHRLCQLDLINDARQGERIVEYYAQKGYGVHRLRQELIKRGIPRELGEAILQKMDPEDQVLDQLVQKQLRRRDAQDPKTPERIASALARRGYAWEKIFQALERGGLKHGWQEE